ncbi:hypothetical protein TBR22_A14730 [Luteitalea sp. TBR-22]|uniref:hypothetical protein n=1 Tax=Luteitalea sp. TBR-22 TaxID=2802971 RepID=UPI001AF73E1F|nr:hypothetical protein [Luteitalea sp. TBR-22]BCS32263.1 hypothetical protein TBR22_A14730 [Luteitalea sp. TBR-22]
MVNAPRVVLIVTLLLVANTALASLGLLPGAVQLVSGLGLVLVPWMVVVVLRDTSVTIRDLEPGQEWGYQDAGHGVPRPASEATSDLTRPPAAGAGPDGDG